MISRQNYSGGKDPANQQPVNGHATEPTATDNTAVAPSSMRYDQIMRDYLTNPVEVMNMRRNLRTWFLNHLPNFEGSWGTTLENQMEHYEVLDELLSELVVLHSNPSAE